MNDVDPAFEQLLEFVRDARGFDYTSYRRPSLTRRVEKRMQAVGVHGYEVYRLYLEEHPEEYELLFNTILINVTSFFRDSESWEALATDVISTLIAQKKPDAGIRVWSAGCASGEEPYTIAMLLCEALGPDAFRERVKIYATDIDEEALAEARDAMFTEKQLEAVPEELRERYFPQVDSGYSFRSDVRRAVIFGRNDLLDDPPISRVDLLVCRNTLMYFEPAAQERILANFYFALKHDGFLMVGKAEALQSRTRLFLPRDLKRRIFVKDPDADRAIRLAPRTNRAELTTTGELPLAEIGFEHASHAEVIVDLETRVAAANNAARALFGLSPRDIGRPLQDLEMSYRPADLRSLVDEVREERSMVSRKDVAWVDPRGNQRTLEIGLAPLTTQVGEFVGVAIAFTDETPHRALREELEHARRELEAAFEELQSTVEELETTNEELQSTNEELETTNEELQSTNEELETMNEELQSTNEELETMNDELRERTDEALRANAFLSSILSGIQQSVVVVDRQLRVTAWSKAAAELWGIRADEAQGEHLMNLDIGLPVGELNANLHATIAGNDVPDAEVRGHNRRGQPIRVRVSFAQLQTHNGDPDGVIVVMNAERDEP